MIHKLSFTQVCLVYWPIRFTTWARTSYLWIPGVPFQYDRTIKNHTRFVQDVRYAPSGDVFVSVGSDSKIFLYDGKTGDTQAQVTEAPHKGSVVRPNPNISTAY